MRRPPKCGHCAIEYQAYKEQQTGFDYEILISIWICPICEHRKSVYTQNDLDCWDNTTKYVPKKTENKDFDLIYDNFRGIPGTITTQKQECSKDKCSTCKPR